MAKGNRRHPRRVFAGSRVLDLVPVPHTRDWEIREGAGHLGFAGSLDHAIGAVRALTGSKVVKVVTPEDKR